MKSDKSRETFHPEKHYSSVRLQQGRVLTDADWNEEADIEQHRAEITTMDIIGQSGVPDPPNGFLLTPFNGDLSVSPGRIYVDGILCELEPPGTSFLTQPDPPTNPLAFPSPPQPSGVVIAYLDVWQRHIGVIEDPSIREVALGGPDTATRAKTVWQIKLLPTNLSSVPGDPDTSQPWLDLTQPQGVPGLLAARAQPTTASTDPCIIPQAAGFRRLENQLYRVEIHTAGGCRRTAAPRRPRSSGAATTGRWWRAGWTTRRARRTSCWSS